MTKTIVPRARDFRVNGRGTATAWNKAPWLVLPRVGSGTLIYETRAKMVYSATGIYVFFDCADCRLACTAAMQDHDDIYRQDVVEVFLWPNPRISTYFEYEMSPLGVELPLLIPNNKGKFMGWSPWHYEGERKITRATVVRGGPKKPGAKVTGWSAECFIPYALLVGLENVPPKPGMRWRGNFYRMDYDRLPSSHWAWSRVKGTYFHDYERFGTIEFA